MFNEYHYILDIVLVLGWKGEEELVVNKTDMVLTCTHLTYMDINQIIMGMINQKRKPFG